MLNHPSGERILLQAFEFLRVLRGEPTFLGLFKVMTTTIVWIFTLLVTLAGNEP
jgi:hypothetical protein